MNRSAPIVFLFVGLLLTACQVGQQARPTATAPRPFTPVLTPTLPAHTPTATQPPTAVSSDTPVPPPTATPSPAHTATATAVPADLAIAAGNITLFPVPNIYTGDTVSFQVQAHVPDNLSPRDVEVRILIEGHHPIDGTLGWRNLGGEAVGLFEWVWDTSGQTGERQITVILDPHDKIQEGDDNPVNNAASRTIAILPAEALPAGEAGAAWIQLATQCCRVFAISGTAAERDLPQLLTLVDAAFQDASARLAEQPSQVYDVYFIDRVIGQGGYAGSNMVISYLDRDYAGGGVYEVLVHEAVHLLDRQFAPNRTAFWAEGVAVWATGGHYKQEDVDRRVSAMVSAGLYVPLEQLLNNFYPTQHEIGYLEAAGLVTYLVNTYGWNQMRAFYADNTAAPNLSPAELADRRLQRHFGRTLAQVESDWLAYLAGRRADQATLDDLRTTLRFYDVMRHYQILYDPTAYFLYAWLPSPNELQQRGITADLSRHPEGELNVTLETMLQSANHALLAGDYNRANVLLDSVSRALNNAGALMDPLANHYLNIVRTAANIGYEAQQIDLSSNQAVVLATRQDRRDGATLAPLYLVPSDQSWILTR